MNLTVYVTDRQRARVAHRRKDCSYLAARPWHWGDPVDVAAERVNEVEVRYRVVVALGHGGEVRWRVVPLCARCG